MSEREIPYRPTENRPGASPRPVPPAHPRTTYLGFYFWWWLGVTALCLLATVFAFAQGAVGAGFLVLLVAGLSALYTRYLFRGGRFRMIFIVF